MKRLSKKSYVLLLVLAVIVLILGHWRISGQYWPVGWASPEKKESVALAKRFPGISERAINSVMKDCDQANYIDWSNNVYERFLKYFTYETYQTYKNTKTCPSIIAKDKSI